jgi:hypothetical protein
VAVVEGLSPTGTSGAGRSLSAAGACPRCGEPWTSLPPVPAATLGGLLIRRCGRCGTRSASPGPGAEPAPPTLVFSCESCGLPFLAGDLLPHADQCCAECRAGELPAGLPDADLAAATEAEVRQALGHLWRVVGSDRLSAYLDRLARQVAGRIADAPPQPRVLVVDDARLRTLALPSGTVLVSRGMLSALEDEAELAFVLAHELAHAASGDAAVRLVRLGFHAVARLRGLQGRGTWGEAAVDLVRLGYGRHRERDADARAFEAVIALGYDPSCVLRLLARLQERIDRADPQIAELASAHPPPRSRAAGLERAFYGKVPERLVLHVNRDVFRRAAGPEALAGLVTAPPIAPRRGDEPEAEPAAVTVGARTLLLAGAVLLALVLLLTLVLRG